MSFLQSLKSNVLPPLVKKGAFGADKVRFRDFKTDPEVKAGDQWQSSIYFGDIVTDTESGGIATQSIVIKTLPEQHIQNNVDTLANELQISNEFLFYSEILPLLQKCDTTGVVRALFPKLFYGSVVLGGDPTQTILIFENVQKAGFKPSESSSFIDYNHITLTLEWLGKFHALSLVCKRKFPGKLSELSSKIYQIKWTEETKTLGEAFFVENGKRGILPLEDDPNYKHKLEDLRAVIDEAVLTMAKVGTAIEPLSLLCHGDFCRNNIFYKYNSDGVPSDVIFFDFGTIRYASPIIDLSFFLFMNSSPEIRSAHWMDMLSTYHSALAKNPDLDPRDVPTLEDIAIDYQRRGICGYVPTAFFLPLMRLEKREQVEWWKMSLDDRIKAAVSRGGKPSTDLLVAIVKHMIDNNFDFRYIKNMRLKSLAKLGQRI